MFLIRSVHFSQKLVWLRIALLQHASTTPIVSSGKRRENPEKDQIGVWAAIASSRARPDKPFIAASNNPAHRVDMIGLEQLQSLRAGASHSTLKPQIQKPSFRAVNCLRHLQTQNGLATEFELSIGAASLL